MWHHSFMTKTLGTDILVIHGGELGKQKTYRIRIKGANHLGKIGLIANFKAVIGDGSNIILPISRYSFTPGSKQPAFKLNKHLTVFSVINLILSCAKDYVIQLVLRNGYHEYALAKTPGTI